MGQWEKKTPQISHTQQSRTVGTEYGAVGTCHAEHLKKKTFKKEDADSLFDLKYPASAELNNIHTYCH